MKQGGWVIFVACVVLFRAALMPVLGWAGPAVSALLALILAVRLGSGGSGATWIAINLYSINTAYGAAVLLWWLGALAASVRPSGKGPGRIKGSWMD